MQIIDVNDIQVGDTFVSILNSDGYIRGKRYTVKDIDYNYVNEMHYIYIKQDIVSSGRIGFPLRKVGSPNISFLRYFDLYFDVISVIRRKKLKKLCE